MSSARVVTFTPGLNRTSSIDSSQYVSPRLYLARVLGLLGLRPDENICVSDLRDFSEEGSISPISSYTSFITPNSIGNWWNKRTPLGDQLSAILDSATAYKLQTMFHLPPFSGYDGAEVLTKLMSGSNTYAAD